MNIDKFISIKDKFLAELKIENSKDLDYYEEKIAAIPSLFAKSVNLLFMLGKEFVEVDKQLELKRSQAFEKYKWKSNRNHSEKEATQKAIEEKEVYDLEVNKGILEEEIKVMESIKKMITDMGFQLKNILTIRQMKMGIMR